MLVLSYQRRYELVVYTIGYTLCVARASDGYSELAKMKGFVSVPCEWPQMQVLKQEVDMETSLICTLIAQRDLRAGVGPRAR